MKAVGATPQSVPDDFDVAAFDAGVLAGRMESICSGQSLEAHESMGDEYCTGFDAGVYAYNAKKEGEKAAKTSLFSCPLLAYSDGPWLAEEWAEGLWSAFSDDSDEAEECRAFQA